jgi:AcrR family transcriptional regulator
VVEEDLVALATKTKGQSERKRRANGEESRERILAAASEIAGERGYNGTSIALVSERSGLPASSIYWHYQDKDTLIAAAIERSFGEWMASASDLTPSPPGGTRGERLAGMMERAASGLMKSCSFLRLGLLLSLEHRDEESSAERMFMQVREEAFRRSVASYAELFPELDEPAVRQLVTFSIAMADGFFITSQLEGDAVDLPGQCEMVAAAVLGAAEHLRTRHLGPRK